MNEIKRNIAKLLYNPIYWGIFVVLVIILSSGFSYLGTEGITYAVIGALIAVVVLPVIGGAIWKQIQAALDGKPSKFDYAVAPGGYRRSRLVETPEEAAAQSAVRPTPHRPLLTDEELDEWESGTIDADPTPVPENSRAAAQAQPRAVATRNGRRFLPSHLELAPDFNPPVDLVIGRAILGVGQRGSGKTNLAALLIERIGLLFVPMAIFDYEEDYLSLPQILQRCIIAGRPDWEESWRYQDYYWQVDEENANDVGYLILEQGVQLVLELGTYKTLEEAARIMVGIIQGMFDWANERDPDLRVPALVLLDEAQHFLPQDSSVSNIKPDEANALLRAFMTLNARGRKRGLTPAIFTQRIAQIRKEVIAGTEIYFLMRQTLNNDLQRYEEIMGKENVDRAQVQGFETGEGIVFESGEAFITRFDQRRSEHKGTTPGIEQAIKRYGNKPFDPRAHSYAAGYRGNTSSNDEGYDVDKLAGQGNDSQSHDSQDNDGSQAAGVPAHPTRPIAPASTALVAAGTEPTAQEQRFINAWVEGYTYDRIAAELNMSIWKVRQAASKLIARGLIEDRKQETKM